VPVLLLLAEQLPQPLPLLLAHDDGCILEPEPQRLVLQFLFVVSAVMAEALAREVAMQTNQNRQ
jgi:hypothetical protein